MHQLPIEQQLLLVIEIAALAVLCLRMWVAGLQKAYTCFFAYLVLELVQALIPLVIPLGSRLYRDLYVLSQAVLVAVYALVVLELYSKVLRDLAGIARVARRYIQATLVLALVGAGAVLSAIKPRATLTGYLNSFELTIMSALAIFVLLVTVFLVYYPVPLGRNVIFYLIGYAVYFLTRDAANTLVISLGRDWGRPLSSLTMGVAVVCLFFWIAALSPKGESKQMVLGHQWNPADEKKLRAQLDAINMTLLRAGKS